MGVAETRVKITLTDNMSARLRNIKGELQSANTAATAFYSALKNAGGAMAGGLGVYSIGDQLSSWVSKGMAFTKTMETNEVGMAGILTSMTRINGRQLEWNEAMGISRKLIRDLNTDAMATAATSEELVGTFRALLGPGLGAGMSIEQIRQFSTIGVNAVKSLGLDGRQVIQELRDLVQGGIQPASSTLATALGLKDSDIKEAKASAEGLYSFLMKRIAGFEQAAAATPKTVAGIEDQIKEGTTLGMAKGLEPVFNEYKDVLLDIKGAIIDPDFGVNEAFVSNIKAASEHAVNMWHGFENVAEVLSPIVVPAIEAAGAGLGIVADNADKVVLAYGLWKLNSMDISKHMNTISASGQQVAQAEVQSALQAAQAVVVANNKKVAAAKNYQSVVSASHKALNAGYIELGMSLLTLQKRYEGLGVSAEQAGKMQIQVAKQAANGQFELAQKIMQTQEKHLQAAKSAQEHANKMQTFHNKLTAIGGVLTSAGILTTSLSDDTDSLANEFGEAAIQAGFFLTGITSLNEALKTLKLTAAGGLGLVATAAAAIGYGAYEKYKHAEAGLGFEYDELGNVSMVGNEADHSAQVAHRRRMADKQKAGIKAELAPAHSKKAEETVSRVQREFEKNERAMNDLMAELDRKVIQLTGTPLEVANAKLDEELQKMQSKIDRAAAAGIDTTAVTAKLAQYEAERNLEIKRQNVIDMHALDMEYIDALEGTRLVSAQRADEMRADKLTAHKQALETMLADERLNIEQRIQLQQEYAEAVKNLQAVQVTDASASWGNFMDYIKNTQFDQLATMQAGWDEMMNSVVNFGQNMLTEQKSWNERCKELANDLANGIFNTFTKVIMQGLVMKSIMSIFPGMGGGGSLQSHNMSSYSSIWNPGNMAFAFANGGVANGWAIVGEEGPELVNFSQPGRVYTAEQTAAALRGSAGLESVKVVIENKSGQPLKASNSNTSFINPREMILNVIVDAVNTNENGIRDVLSGAVGNYG